MEQEDRTILNVTEGIIWTTLHDLSEIKKLKVERGNYADSSYSDIIF